MFYSLFGVTLARLRNRLLVEQQLVPSQLLPAPPVRLPLPWYGCGAPARGQPIVLPELRPDPVPTLESSVDLSAIEADPDHELTRRKSRVRRKRQADSASKLRRSERLAALEPAKYVPVAEKASKAKAAKFDMAGVSRSLATALEESGVLTRPPPAAISASKLKSIGRACVPRRRLAELDAVVVPRG